MTDMKTQLLMGAACAALLTTPLASPSLAADESLFGTQSAAVTFGPYARLELGLAGEGNTTGYWQPPGYPSDPEVHFDLSGDETGFGALAMGYDWMNGWRAEGALMIFGSRDYAGAWSYTIPDEPGPHATIDTAPLQTLALFANGYYSPLEARGENSRINPYLTAGIGVASHDMGDWTRSNPDADQTVRSFEGAGSSSIAFNIGAGVSMQLSKPGKRPVLLDATYRYFDLGNAEGGATPLAGSGTSEPVTPLTIHRRDHVVSIGLRFPLGTY